MSDRSQERSVVVVGVDGSDDGVRAVEYGVHEARRRGAGLRLVHVQPQTVAMAPMLPLVPGTTLHEMAAAVVKRAEELARSCGWDEPDLEGVLADGPRVPSLIDHARGAAAIVVGRRSSTVDHLLSGSTTSSLAAHAGVPVISVPEGWDVSRVEGPVVTGVDGHESLHELWDVSLVEARCRGARLEILHAWRPPGQYDVAVGGRVQAERWRAAALDALRTRIDEEPPSSDVEWQVEAQYERPALALYEASKRAQLLILGQHGHVGHRLRGTGSKVRTLLRTSHCPVMVVPTSHHHERSQSV